MSDTTTKVTAHYGRYGALTQRILDEMLRVGYDLARLRANDLAPLDQFHQRGRQATRQLAECLAPGPGDLVLDVGCGIGGPARLLAEQRACRVLGIDLTEAYCETARALSGLVGLAARTSFVCADATALPLRTAIVDQAWSQHAAMNIADKPALYAEIARVLKPGGRFVLHDVVAGPVGEPYYPEPWAADPAQSFLIPPEAVIAAVTESGLRLLKALDEREATLEWFRGAPMNPPGGEAPSRLAVLGEELAGMVANLGRSLEERRLGILIALFEKPAA